MEVQYAESEYIILGPLGRRHVALPPDGNMHNKHSLDGKDVLVH
jgi:hypothetical protein